MAKLIVIVCCLASFAVAREPINVWLDVDTSAGLIKPRVKDVDDGLALVQAFHSPEINIRGVSVCFGNAPLAEALPIAREITRRFGPSGLGVFSGAAAAADLGVENDATRALAKELEQRQLTILALGPVTNVATVLKNRTDLRGKVRQIVVCAARRPGFGFYVPDRPEAVLPDANFEKDAPAMQLLLDSGVQIVFAGYESSCDTWLSREDLESIAGKSESGKWVRDVSQDWIARWESMRGPRGFNPFDTLCVGYITHPGLLQTIEVSAHITTGPDDRAGTGLAATRPTKPYLIAEPHQGNAVKHIYCTSAKPEFRQTLLARLVGPPAKE